VALWRRLDDGRRILVARETSRLDGDEEGALERAQNLMGRKASGERAGRPGLACGGRRFERFISNDQQTTSQWQCHEQTCAWAGRRLAGADLGADHRLSARRPAALVLRHGEGALAGGQIWKYTYIYIYKLRGRPLAEGVC
jgi:hypothetical protein